jgi:hypothetical protein
MHKPSAWIRSRPLITVFLAAATIGLGFHLFANWRAERRWQAYAAEARTRGVKLALTEFAPLEIPDAENFAALPMMRAIFANGAKSPMALPEKGRPSFGNPLKGERFDWEKWQKFFKEAGFISEITNSPPRDVLRALEHYTPQFEEWSQRTTRTRCRFALDLKAGTAMRSPHLGLFQDASKLFSLRMRAHLALGEPTAAYDDFRGGFHAYRALAEEPTLISGLVRIALLTVLTDAIRDGLNDHAWRESELRNIDADLATIRIWEDYTRAFSSERGFGNVGSDELLAMSPLGRARKMSTLWEGPFTAQPPPFKSWIGALVPDRLIRDDQLRENRYMDELLACVSTDGMSFDPDSPTPSDANHMTESEAHYFSLFKDSAPIFAEVAQRYVFVQTRLDQAHLAIALERFGLIRGVTPETLTELVPDFIAEVPRDIYTREPMIYRRTEDGGFLLYSVGPNRRDDGGAIDPKRSETKQPDWVWLGSGK